MLILILEQKFNFKEYLIVIIILRKSIFCCGVQCCNDFFKKIIIYIDGSGKHYKNIKGISVFGKIKNKSKIKEKRVFITSY